MKKWNNLIYNMSKITILCLFFAVSLYAKYVKITMKHPVLNMKIPAEWESEPVVILSDSIELELKEKKHPVLKRKNNILIKKNIKWYKINKPSSGELKTIKTWYYNYLEKKPTVRIDAVYKDDKIKRIFGAKHLDSLYYTYSLKGHKLSANLLKISIPDYSNIKYIRIEKNHTIHRVEEYYHFAIRNIAYNVMNKDIKLLWPASYKLNYGLENREGLKLKTTNNIIDGKNVFSIKANNIKEMEGEGNYKYPEQWFSALFISFQPKGNNPYSWEQMGQHYFDMIYDSLSKTDTSIIDSIANIIPGSNNKDEIIKNTFNFVKDNIRYYGSWENFYGWIPRGPKEVLEKGYGDCKEMANVLAMLLRKKGINASLTLLRRNKDYYFKIIKKYPTLGLSDHVITCVEKSNGQRLYLDATTKNSSYNTSYYEYLNQPVLVIKKNGSYLDIVKPETGYQNQINTDSKIKQDKSNPNKWILEGTVKYHGKIANDLYMRLKRSKDKDETLDYFLKRILKTKPEKAEFKKQTPLEIIVDYSVDISENVLTSPAKGLIFSTPSIYTPYSSYSDLSYAGDRYLCKVSQYDTWIYPEEFKVLNTSNLNSSLGTGEWNSLGSSSKGKLLTRKYNCDFKHIDASERDKLKVFFNERNNFERGIAWSENPK